MIKELERIFPRLSVVNELSLKDQRKKIHEESYELIEASVDFENGIKRFSNGIHTIQEAYDVMQAAATFIYLMEVRVAGEINIGSILENKREDVIKRYGGLKNE